MAVAACRVAVAWYWTEPAWDHLAMTARLCVPSLVRYEGGVEVMSARYVCVGGVLVVGGGAHQRFGVLHPELVFGVVDPGSFFGNGSRIQGRVQEACSQGVFALLKYIDPAYA